MNLKLAFKKSNNNEIKEYEVSSNQYYPEDTNVYVNRDFLPNLTFFRYIDYNQGIYLNKYKAIRETAASYLIIDGDRERWIRKNALRSFCQSYREIAWKNFIHRKRKQREILKNRLDYVERTLNHIDNIHARN